jgi:hypothetical protein
MDMDQFWQLIDQTQQASGLDVEKQAALLTAALASMSLQEVVDYQHHFDRLHGHADLNNLYEVAALISGGLGDSSWSDFRAWLIGRGQTIYENALADPETLVDVAPVEARWDADFEAWDVTAELLLYSGYEAYQKITGDENAFPPRLTDNELVDSGENLWKGCKSAEEHDRRVKAKFPKAWEKFGWELPE